MSNFSANIEAILDTTKIPSQIKNIEKSAIITFKKVALDTNGLSSQIQASLDKHKFTIKLDGIKSSNMEASSRGVKKSINEIQSAYNDLMKLQQRINSTRIQISGLDATKNKAQIVELSQQLNRLMSDYNNLYTSFGHRFSTDQIDNLNRSFEIASEKISVINAKAKDTAASFTKVSEPVSNLKFLTLDNKMITWLEKNSRAAKDFGDAIQALRNKLNTLNATFANSCESSKLYPSLAKSAVELIIPETLVPISFAIEPAFDKNLLYEAFVSLVTFFSSVISASIETTLLNISFKAVID